MKKQLGLTFKDKNQESAVYLDGKSVGTIRQLAYGAGWFYQPKGSMEVGATMKSRDEVKRSLR